MSREFLIVHFVWNYYHLGFLDPAFCGLLKFRPNFWTEKLTSKTNLFHWKLILINGKKPRSGYVFLTWMIDNLNSVSFSNLTTCCWKAVPSYTEVMRQILWCLYCSNWESIAYSSFKNMCWTFNAQITWSDSIDNLILPVIEHSNND